MKNRWKKGVALLMAASMLMANIQVTAEEGEPQAQAVTEAPAEPQTQAVTEAPTEPQTQAPTEAPTEPQTQAPTEPQTQAPTEPQTQAPTEPQTQVSTEASTEPQTQAPTEAATESQTEKKEEKKKGVYVLEEDDYTVEVKVPDDLKLAKGTKLTMTKLSENEDRRKEAFALMEEANGVGTIGAYQVYDLHFEMNGQEVKLSDRTSKDIKVKVTFDTPAFRGEDLVNQELKVFHRKKRTEQELTQAKELAQPNGQDTDEPVSEDKAEELDAKIELTDEKNGVKTVTFKTDGFSDYLFGVTKEPESETETEGESETESVTEPQTEGATEPQTEGVTEPQTDPVTEAATEADVVENAGLAVLSDEMKAVAYSNLEIALENIGAQGQEYTLTITSSIAADNWEARTDSGTSPDDTQGSGDTDSGSQGGGDSAAPEDLSTDVLFTTAAGTQSVKTDAEKCIYEKDAETIRLTLKIPAEVTKVTLKNLRRWIGDAEVNGGLTYQIDAGGNTFDAAKTQIVGTQAYSTLYVKDETDAQGGVSQTSPVQMQMTGDRMLTVKNIYTVLRVQLPDELSASVNLGLNGTWLQSNVPVTAGRAEIKGLPVLDPAEAYTVELLESSLPKTYAEQTKNPTKQVTLSETAWEGTTEFTEADGIRKIRVLFRSMDDKGKLLANTKFTVKKDKTVVGEVKGGGELTGVLERGGVYIVSQERVPGYVTPSSLKLTVKNTSVPQQLTMKNKPTKVTVSVLDPYKKLIADAGLQIETKDGKVVHTFTSAAEATVLEAILDPGTEYVLVQTSAPKGYFAAERKTFKVSAAGTATVSITDKTVKVVISRKGYDDHDEKKAGKDGYDKKGYLNLKMIAGSQIELQDLQGNVIDSWTSEATAPHVIEGKLAAGETYKLVEKKTPGGYRAAKEATFPAPTTSATRTIAFASMRASGTIQVVKRVTYKGSPVKVNQTFYCALFTDAAHTNLYAAGGVRALQMTSGSVYAVANFTEVPAGIYYVAETDRNGKVVDGSQASPKYTVTISNEQLNMNGTPLISEIVNNYQTAPSGGYTYIDPKELQQSYAEEYAGYGGSAQSASELAAGDPVSTGDSTNIWRYAVLLAAAAVLFAVGWTVRRKRKK